MLAFTPELHQYFGMEPLASFVRSREILELDGVLVDVEAILRRHYRCDCTSCLHTGPNGRLAGDCCHGAQIRLSAGERHSLLEHLPGILPYMESGPRQAVESRLARDRGDRTHAFCQPVWINGRRTDLYALRRQPNSDCLFRFIRQAGSRHQVLCAVHAYLLDQGLPQWGIKPLTCLVWPLVLVPLADGHLLLTLHTLDTYMFTGEGRYHTSRPCLTAPRPDAPFVYQSCGPELRHLFGAAFYDHLLDTARGQAERWRPAWGQPDLWPQASNASHS